MHPIGGQMRTTAYGASGLLILAIRAPASPGSKKRNGNNNQGVEL